jgi:hypothetical protein
MKALVRRYIEDCSVGDAEGIEDVLDPGFVKHLSGPAPCMDCAREAQALRDIEVLKEQVRTERVSLSGGGEQILALSWRVITPLCCIGYVECTHRYVDGAFLRRTADRLWEWRSIASTRTGSPSCGPRTCGWRPIANLVGIWWVKDGVPTFERGAA